MMLAWKPNWRDRVSVKREFRTEIITARNGSEQRRVLRDSPRKEVSFTALVYAEDRQQIVADLAQAVRTENTIADPTRSATCNTVTGAVLTVEQGEEWLAAGYQIAFDDGAVATIQSVSGTQVTLASSPGVRPVPFKVRPLLQGFLDSDITARVYTSKVWELPVRLTVNPGSEPLSVDEVDDFRVHAGRRVWTVAPNWEGDGEFKVAVARQTVDYSYGAIANFHPHHWVDRIQDWTFSPCQKSEIAYIESVFRESRGRAGEFLLPTFQDDLTPIAALAEGENALPVAGQTCLGMESDPIYRYLWIQLRDGRVWVRTVTGSAASGDNATLTVDRQFYETAPPGSIAKISLMSVARFATDTLVTDWVTAGVAAIRTSFVTLPVRPSEEGLVDLDDDSTFMIEVFDDAAFPFMDRIDTLLNIEWRAIFVS